MTSRILNTGIYKQLQPDCSLHLTTTYNRGTPTVDDMYRHIASEVPVLESGDCLQKRNVKRHCRQRYPVSDIWLYKDVDDRPREWCDRSSTWRYAGGHTCQNIRSDVASQSQKDFKASTLSRQVSTGTFLGLAIRLSSLSSRIRHLKINQQVQV